MEPTSLLTQWSSCTVTADITGDYQSLVQSRMNPLPNFHKETIAHPHTCWHLHALSGKYFKSKYDSTLLKKFQLFLVKYYRKTERALVYLVTIL